MRVILARYEPLLARTLSDAVLAGWLVGSKEIAEQLPSAEAEGGVVPPGTILPSPFELPPEPEEPIIRFPEIEAAAHDLATRRLLMRDEYDRLDWQARQTAFTMARVATLDALERLQAALTQDVIQGGTLRQFQATVEQALGESALSPAHVENVYRTNVGLAYANAQRETLDHPLVSDEFPYVAYHSVHDERRRPEHGALENLGIQGTNIYRRDDPVIQRFWPPWAWQCRCAVIPLTLEDAAAQGIAEAQEWLRTGLPPQNPAYVPMPDFAPPPGWDRGLVSVHL